MPVRRLSLIAASAALLSAPAGAEAATYCVEKPACAGLDMTLQGALDEAAATPADDRVEIGAVTLAPAAYSYAPAIDAGGFVLVGAGRTQTLLQNAPASEQPALRVIRGPGGNPMRVASLGVRLSTAPGSFAYGVRTGAVLEDVDVATPAPMAGTMLGVDLLTNAVMRDSAVTLQATGNDPTQRVGVFASESGVLVERSVIDAPHALYAQGNLRVARTRVRARGGMGIHVCRSLARIDNTVVRFAGAGPGIDGNAGCVGGQATGRTELRQVTLRGDGSAGSVGVACASYNADHPSSVLVRGTLVDNVDYDVGMTADNSIDASCLVEAGNSRIDLASRKTAGEGKNVATNLGGNTVVAPGFVNAATGDFRLRSDSSMLDVGPSGPIDAALESIVDLLGEPRSVHRNGVGPARRDIGAFEFQPQGLGLGDGPQPGPGTPAPVPPVQPPGAPTPPAQAPGPGAPAPVPSPKPDAKDTRAPGLSRLAVRSAGRTVRTLRSTKRATARLRLTLGERALVAVEVQRRVGKRWVRTATLKRALAAGAPSMSMGTALRRAAAGSYRLRVHATDAAGNRSALRSLAFTIARL